MKPSVISVFFAAIRGLGPNMASSHHRHSVCDSDLWRLPSDAGRLFSETALPYDHHIVRLMIPFTGFVLCDQPYGLGFQSWDQNAMNQAQLMGLLQSILSNCLDSEKAGLPVAFWTPVNEFSTVMKAFAATGFVDVETIAWQKPQQNQHGPPHKLIQCMEYCLIGHYQAKVPTRVNLPSNPLLRAPHISAPSVRSLHKDPSSGEVINPYQKPISVTQYLMRMYASAGELVMVLGTGSGAEVEAAMSLGLRAVGFERMQPQWTASQYHIEKYAAALED